MLTETESHFARVAGWLPATHGSPHLRTGKGRSYGGGSFLHIGFLEKDFQAVCINNP